MSFNQATLIGNVGNDPEIRSMQNGNQVASFSLATSKSWKNKNTGARETKTEWHRIVIFNKGLVTVVQNYVRKGSKLMVQGEIQTRKWTDQSGNDKYATEIVLDAFNGVLNMLDSRGGNQQQSQGQTGFAQQDSGFSNQPAQQHDDFEDEIPF